MIDWVFLSGGGKGFFYEKVDHTLGIWFRKAFSDESKKKCYQ